MRSQKISRALSLSLQGLKVIWFWELKKKKQRGRKNEKSRGQQGKRSLTFCIPGVSTTVKKEGDPDRYQKPLKKEG